MTRSKVFAAVILLCAAPASSALAHGVGPDLAFYGNVGASAARCQRIIARAAEQCAATAIRARNTCMTAQLNGQPCDTAAADATVSAAREAAASRVEAQCSDQDAVALQFASVSEVQADITNACSQLGTSAMSAAFGPTIATGGVGTVGGMTTTCMDVTATAIARLLRFATSVRRQAFDRMAVGPLSVAQKEGLLARAARRIANARALITQHIEASCPDDSFTAVYHRSVGDVIGSALARADCMTGASYVQSAVVCPASVCGNGIQEPGEACDDGNDYDADGCHNDCTKHDCQLFPSTFDLIQQAIFENHGCTNALCHGVSQMGGLDLRAGNAYANLVDVPSVAGTLKRVEPGIEEHSLLWLKLAAATQKRMGVPGSPMPQNLPPLSSGELEAVRQWIYSGAPRTGVVPHTAELLNACLPPPEPIQIRPAAPPAPGTGVQLHMARWVLQPQSESEVCFAGYYDFTDQVPPEFRGADGTTLRFNRELTTQDPLSHHLVTQFYKGQVPPDDPVWGTYTCRGGAADGQPCNPTTLGGCGADGECATVPVKSVACIGFGPPDAQVPISSLGFGGTQQTVTDVQYAPGVYAEIPLKGVILWNSHAFNLSDQAGKLEAWVNFYFAPPVDQLHPVQEILNIDDVFAMNVAPFTTQEVCNVHVVPSGAQLFELSSHMHKRGKRFDIFRGAFRCDGGSRSGQACSPQVSDMCPDAVCRDTLGQDPAQSLIYTSLIYNDPAVLRFDPPMPFAGAAAERSLTYCALYDNGFTHPEEVKRQSTSPPTPLSGFGGPCNVPTNCVAGKLRAPCSGLTPRQRNAACDSTPGAGDGLCDACPLHGGVTTEDEMFILLGEYFFQ